MFSVPRGGSLAVWTCFLIEPYLGGFSYSCLMVPSNCLCLIFVCHFLCLFGANSKSWIGWQTKETGWHWAVRVMPSHLLHQRFQAGAKWAEVQQKGMRITMLKLFKQPFGSPVIYTERTSFDRAEKGSVFCSQAACVSKWVQFLRFMLLIEPWGEPQMVAPQQFWVISCEVTKGHIKRSRQTSRTHSRKKSIERKIH